MKAQLDPAYPAAAASNLPAGRRARPFSETLKIAAAVRPEAKPVAARPAGVRPTSPAKTPPAAKPEAQPKPTQPLPKPTAPAPRPAAPEFRPTSTKAALAISQMKMRAASQVRRAVAESRTRSSRQLAASRAVDLVHTSAHAASAKASAGRQDERAEDRVRVGLFQALERECVEAPGPGRAALLQAEPERASAPQAGTRGSELQPAAAAQSSDSTRVSTERAEAVAALVERIEAALKDGRPTLSLGLADRSGASSVEIARTGKGEVSVRISARPGRKTRLAAAGEEIKSALAARGLRLRSLVVG